MSLQDAPSLLAVLAGLGVRLLGATTAAILVALVLVPLALFATPVCVAAALALGMSERSSESSPSMGIGGAQIPGLVQLGGAA